MTDLSTLSDYRSLAFRLAGDLETLHDLAEDLRRLQLQEPISARPVSPGERFVLWAKRRPAMAAVYLLVGLVLILGGMGGGAMLIFLAGLRHAGQGECVRSDARRGEASALLAMKKRITRAEPVLAGHWQG